MNIKVVYDDQTDNLIVVAEDVQMAFAITRDGDWSKAPEAFERLKVMAGGEPCAP